MTYKQLKRLNLTHVQPAGWLTDQLQLQMDGLSGKLHEFWDSVGSYSGWLGGTGESWERAPYYLDGLLPLAYYLQDEKQWDLCMRFINWTLASQDESGNFGPISTKYDRWSRYAMIKVLIQYYEITEDAKVLVFVKNYIQYFEQSLTITPVAEWSRARIPDLMYCIKWLYEQTNDESLLASAAVINQHSLDWNEFLEELPFPHPTKYYIDWENIKSIVPHAAFDSVVPFHATHIVNVTMGFKHPAMQYFFTGQEHYREIAQKGINRVIDCHGVASGCINGDEHLAGNNPTQGAELCSVVEYMFSLQSLIEMFGQSSYGDMMERLAYNALPATITEDFMAHQYLQQANQVQVDVYDRPWFNNTEDSSVFGLEPHFGCCTANMHQGWPKFVQSLWYTEENSLVNMVFAPSVVNTQLNGQNVSVELVTEYPFRDQLCYQIKTASTEEMTLKFRLPAWCDAPVIVCDGATITVDQDAKMISVCKCFSEGEQVLVTLPMNIACSSWYKGSVAVERGPLVYGLDIKENWQPIKEVAGITDYAVFADSPWNYALNTNETMTATEQPLGNVPFSKQYPAVKLSAKGQQVPSWTLVEHSAGEIPTSFDVSAIAEEEITLIPFGCTKLRVSQFPSY